jgi:hypothetical protein
MNPNEAKDSSRPTRPGWLPLVLEQIDDLRIGEPPDLQSAGDTDPLEEPAPDPDAEARYSAYVDSLSEQSEVAEEDAPDQGDVDVGPEEPAGDAERGG